MALVVRSTAAATVAPNASLLVMTLPPVVWLNCSLKYSFRGGIWQMKLVDAARRGATKMTLDEMLAASSPANPRSAGVQVTGDRAAGSKFAQRRLVGLAHRHGARAAGVEAASGRRSQRA